MDKKYLSFNINMIIAGLTGAVIASKIGSVFDELYSQHELTSFVVSLSHFILAFIIFSFLYYLTNRKKYYNYFSKKIWSDFGKIYGTFVPSLIIFYILFFAINDLLLRWSFSAIISSIGAWVVGTLFSRVIHTFLAHKVGVFRD